MFQSPTIYNSWREKGKISASNLAREHGMKTARISIRLDKWALAFTIPPPPILPASHFSFFLETCILFGITSVPSCFDKAERSNPQRAPCVTRWQSARDEPNWECYFWTCPNVWIQSNIFIHGCHFWLFCTVICEFSRPLTLFSVLFISKQQSFFLMSDFGTEKL